MPRAVTNACCIMVEFLLVVNEQGDWMNGAA